MQARSSAIDRATQVLETLAVHTETPDVPAEPPSAPAPGAQLGLFTEYVQHPAVDELQKLDLESMTPMQAFDALRRLLDQIEEDHA